MLENKEGLPWSAYVGVVGMPGKNPLHSPRVHGAHDPTGETAVYAWNEFSKAKKGETVFVSAGSGACLPEEIDPHNT